MKRVLCRLFVIWVALAAVAFAQEDVVMKAMRDEMSRTVGKLQLPNLEKPYFISYRVEDSKITSISATLGRLTSSNILSGRGLYVQVRVGDYAHDNTNFLSVRSGPNLANRYELPVDNDYEQLRREIWLATDAEYKEAAETFAAKNSVLEHREGGSNLPDFTKMPPTTINEVPVKITVDTPQLEKVARDTSDVFRKAPDLLASGVAIVVRDTYTRYLTTEGTSYTRAEPLIVFSARVQIQGTDNKPIQDSFDVYARTLDELRADELLARTQKMLEHVEALRAAKSIELYNGPVLFEGEAAAEVVGQVFAPAVVSARFPITDEPQFEANLQQTIGQLGASLADKLNGRVMPSTFDVTDAPQAKDFRGTPLVGGYQIDDEGVPTREVKIVEGGILKALLATRTPTVQAKASTGSARFFGATPSNLFVSSRKPVSDEELRKQLVETAKERGYDYGIIVRHVGAGGLSYFMRMAGTMGGGAPSPAVDEIYKHYADGHEELISGSQIEPLMVASFKDIVAAGDKQHVYNEPFVPMIGSIFNGNAGSVGSIAPVSFVVPSLLFEEATVKQATGPAPKPPVVPAPAWNGN